MRTEKRKHSRFIAQEDAYAALGTDFTRVGKLKEISIGGLVFEYIDFTKCACEESSRVDIFLSDNEFHLPKIACRLVCDRAVRVIDSNSSIKSSYTVNRCTIQFTDITRIQKERLEYFLKHHTQGLASDQDESFLGPGTVEG